MPLSDSLDKLTRDKAKVDFDGVVHSIRVMQYVRDDESVYYEAKCICQDYHGLPKDTPEEAEEAGLIHIQQIKPAPKESTYTSIIRLGLGKRK